MAIPSGRAAAFISPYRSRITGRIPIANLILNPRKIVHPYSFQSALSGVLPGLLAIVEPFVKTHVVR